MYKRVNIGLRDDVYNKLKDKGRFGESFSELVSRLIDDSNSTNMDSSVRRGSD
jgi:predicted CopG family antitoxin